MTDADVKAIVDAIVRNERWQLHRTHQKEQRRLLRRQKKTTMPEPEQPVSGKTEEQRTLFE